MAAGGLSLVAAFTGRQAELGQLMARWAEAAVGGGVVGIHAIGGMAGIGKTTFAVHAAHRLAGDFPDGQFFLPLHAHTPGQRPVDPADALASLLPDIDAHAAAALDGSGVAAVRRHLEALYDQHLITEPARGRYRFHDLIREHARTLAAADDPAIRDAAATRLLDYYLHTARAAGQHFPSGTTAEAPAPPGRPPVAAGG